MPEEDREATTAAPATSRRPRQAEGAGTNGDTGEPARLLSRLPPASGETRLTGTADAALQTLTGA
jgi:hypothetical protein